MVDFGIERVTQTSVGVFRRWLKEDNDQSPYTAGERSEIIKTISYGLSTVQGNALHWVAENPNCRLIDMEPKAIFNGKVDSKYIEKTLQLAINATQRYFPSMVNSIIVLNDVLHIEDHHELTNWKIALIYRDYYHSIKENKQRKLFRYVDNLLDMGILKSHKAIEILKNTIVPLRDGQITKANGKYCGYSGKWSVQDAYKYVNDCLQTYFDITMDPDYKLPILTHNGVALTGYPELDLYEQ